MGVAGSGFVHCARRNKSSRGLGSIFILRLFQERVRWRVTLEILEAAGEWIYGRLLYHFHIGRDDDRERANWTDMVT